MAKVRKIVLFIVDGLLSSIGDEIRRTEEKARKERKFLSKEFYRKKANYEQNKARYELYKNRL